MVFGSISADVQAKTNQSRGRLRDEDGGGYESQMNTQSLGNGQSVVVESMSRLPCSPCLSPFISCPRLQEDDGRPLRESVGLS